MYVFFILLYTMDIHISKDEKSKGPNQHRYDIDYIRVIAFGILILYHVAVFFEPGSWHIKNNITYREILFPMIFINQWRLPLLFVVSGMGTYFALGKRTGKQYARERLKRLLLPLHYRSTVYSSSTGIY